MNQPTSRVRRALLLTGLTLVTLPSGAWAQGVGKNGATVEKWAEGLAGAQGIVRAANGEILIAEHDAGRVARFDASGKRLGVLAEGLQAPSWMLFHNGSVFVSERRGNSVARIVGSTLTRLPGEVIDPLGLALDPKQPGALLVLSHRQSHVRRFSPDAGGSYKLDTQPVFTPASGAQYGWRDLLVARDGTVYVTDEVSRAVLRRKPGGALEEWVTNLASPSGLALSPAGHIYVTEEGGRVSRISENGTPVVLAEGLGAARALLFLDDRTLLVTDRRGGAVWKVRLPAP